MTLRRIAIAALALATQGLAPPPGVLELKLAPGPIDVARGRGVLDVTLRIPAVDAPAGAPILTLPIVIANTATIADTLQDLQASDASGPVPLSVRDDPEAMVYARHWLAGRAVKGDLVVRYRAPIDDTRRSCLKRTSHEIQASPDS